MNTDLIKYSLKNLISRRTRSLLTILSILIGIMAIFALVSFGQGIGRFTDEMFQEMGTDKLLMMPKGYGVPGTGSVKFSKEDMDFIKKIKGVGEIAGYMITSGEVKTKDEKKPRYPFIMGMPTEADERRLVEEIMAGFEISEGRALKKGDRLKAALGHNYQIANKVFKKPLKLGDKIIINGFEADVVGFYEEVGNPEDDRNVYLSLEGYMEIFDSDEEYSIAIIRAASDEDPGELAERVEEKFRKRKGQKEGEEDFYVQSFEQMMEIYGNVIVVLNGVLVIIALISLIVAAVNIMNTMYTAVLERTREIGIMKAIGSRNKDIFTVFVVESGFLGLIGGTLGIIAGYGVAKTGEFAARAAGLSMLKPYFPFWLIIGCMMFAFLVGAGSGLLPAVKASRLKPVDSLRYE
ncbi:ABC transporter permease [Candidatus Woesearchaeota archaeon]|nr:ABC transporter permease [Candidatus Woesearchaeota archaeon]